MRSTFGGLEIARRSLASQQLALNVTGHNIANANTPGYTRQVAVLKATAPYTVPGHYHPGGVGQVGTGVEVGVIRRLGDRFIQAEMNKEARNTGYWTSRQHILRQIEVALMEPSDTGIQNALQQYWAALQELHKSPASHAVRSVVAERAGVLAETIRFAYSQLLPIQRELDASMQSMVQRINVLAEQIATLNWEISQAIVVGYQPNDLLDQRDLLVQELSRLTGATAAQRNQGMIAVVVGGITLVDGTHTRAIAAEPEPGHVHRTRFVWSDLGTEVTFDGGEMKGHLEGRDVLIPEYIEQLNKLASTIITETNKVHRQGIGLNQSTGLDFFTGTDASDIGVNELILADPSYIAASKTGEPGDGDNALAMARLSQMPLVDGTATLDNYFASIVSRLGVISQKALHMVEHQADVENHLAALRESVAGVSLDEEMTNMIMFQHAYAAAARVVTAMDEALETLILRTGLVGR